MHRYKHIGHKLGMCAANVCIPFSSAIQSCYCLCRYSKRWLSRINRSPFTVTGTAAAFSFLTRLNLEARPAPAPPLPWHSTPSHPPPKGPHRTACTACPLQHAQQALTPASRTLLAFPLTALPLLLRGGLCVKGTSLHRSYSPGLVVHPQGTTQVQTASPQLGRM